MKILLAIYGTTDGIEMLRAAQAFRSLGFDVSVHVVGQIDMILDRIGPAQAEGLRLSDASGPVSLDAFASKRGADPTRLTLARLPGRALRYAKFRAGRFLRATFAGELLGLWLDRMACRRLLRRENPYLLVLPLESVGHHSATLAASAHASRIPTLIVPYTVPVNVPELAERFYYDRAYWLDRPFARLVGRLWPQWVTLYRGRRLLRLKARDIVARWLFGLMPDRPWDAGGLQYAGAVAVENGAMMAFYRRERFPEEKLHLTGTIADDLLAKTLERREELKRRLYERLSLDPRKQLLLCGFPPDFTSREDCDFKSFDELIDFWKSTLSSLRGFNVVIRPHPSLLPRDLDAVQPDNIRVVTDDTAGLLPLCDLYVASVSSTIRWAIACGIPTINYDVFRFRYHDFDAAPGVVRMEDRVAFAATIKRLDDDPSELESLRAVQEKSKSQWGKLDGQAAKRMAALIGRLVGPRAPDFVASPIHCAAE